ncbi:hypothetical protein SAMN04490220_0436 [Rhodococcus jostii]|uniref:Uncharacterized protein n=2 Tax=Rhodococcus jostii TaxID=132919 RepID=A0A1H4IU39_RHOJO|nr:hypothetical protein SAMN04490220_0436 [Rhodococcus jostii]
MVGLPTSGSDYWTGTPTAELAVAGVHRAECAIGSLVSAVVAVVRTGTAVPGADAVINKAPSPGKHSPRVHAVVDRSTDALADFLVETPGIASVEV